MKSRAYSQRIQDHALRGGPSPLPDSLAFLYATLWNGDPKDCDSQSGSDTAQELGGITRGQIERGALAWGGNGQSLVNAVMVSIFAGEHDGKRTATHWQLGTEKTGDGLAIISGKLKREQEVVSGMILEIPPGALRSDEF